MAEYQPSLSAGSLTGSARHCPPDLVGTLYGPIPVTSLHVARWSSGARPFPPPVDHPLHSRAADPQHHGDVAEALAGQPKVSGGLLLSRRQLSLRPELHPVSDCPSATLPRPDLD